MYLKENNRTISRYELVADHLISRNVRKFTKNRDQRSMPKDGDTCCTRVTLPPHSHQHQVLSLTGEAAFITIFMAEDNNIHG